MAVKVKYLGPVVDKLREATNKIVLLNSKKTAIHVREAGEGRAKTVKLKDGVEFKAKKRVNYATINVFKNKAGEFILAAAGTKAHPGYERANALLAGIGA